MQKPIRFIQIFFILLLFGGILSACSNAGNGSELDGLNDGQNDAMVSQITNESLEKNIVDTLPGEEQTQDQLASGVEIASNENSQENGGPAQNIGDYQKPEIVWSATHETGGLEEWNQIGGFYRQGPTGSYHMVTPFAHSGSYSVGLTIDTLVPTASEEEEHAAYLFVTDQKLIPDDAYYYSAWFYLPADVEPVWWWNVYQWKTTYDGNTDNSMPTYLVGIERWENHGLRAYLSVHINIDTEGIQDYHQEIMAFPTQQWVQIEGYYKKAVDNTGQVIIWQDGVELFNLSGVRTTMADNTVYWSINSYTDEINPNPLTILIDDAAISKTRLGPNTPLIP